MFSRISTLIDKFFAKKVTGNFRDEEIVGEFRVRIPIFKVEVTDKYRVITAHGVYNDKPIGFKLQIPRVAESWNLDKKTNAENVQHVVTNKKMQIYSSIFYAVGEETLNLFNMLGVGKFKKIKPAVEFTFMNLVGDINQIDNRCESNEMGVCLNYSDSSFPRKMAKNDIRMKIANYREDDVMENANADKELEFLVDISPSEKAIYFMEKNTRDRRNLRYVFSDCDPKEIESILKSADQGDSESQFLAGNIYESGTDGINSDTKRALFYWGKSAESGNVAAQNRLADMYEAGQYVKQDFQKSRELYQKAADKNNPHALYHLGVMYEHGLGIEIDIDKAIGYYKKAAESGYVNAQVALADLYLMHKRKISKACELYKIALKQADIYHGIAMVYWMLGSTFCFMGGAKTGVTKDEALSFLKKGFLLGKSDALFLYTSIGLNQGFGEDGHQWICDMNEKYPDDPYCAFAMGLLYCYGALPQDYDKAFKYYKIAAESSMDIHEAMHELAALYYNGRGTTQDEKTGFKWEIKAAEKLPIAQFNVGASYLNGIGVEKNVEKAVEWFRKAAANGYVEAEKALESI